jgi:hypothetical protein
VDGCEEHYTNKQLETGLSAMMAGLSATMAGIPIIELVSMLSIIYTPSEKVLLQPHPV